MTNIVSDLAKTMMKMKPVRATKDAPITGLAPYFSAAQPLS